MKSDRNRNAKTVSTLALRRTKCKVCLLKDIVKKVISDFY